MVIDYEDGHAVAYDSYLFPQNHETESGFLSVGCDM